MSDKEFGGADDLQLPKATVQKILTEIIPANSGLSSSKDFRDSVAECAVEFIGLIASEANEISEKEAKKTIGCEHIVAALKELGFDNYIPPVLEAAEEHRRIQASRERRTTKMEQSGLTEEELIQQQQELFRSATDKFNAGPTDGKE